MEHIPWIALGVSIVALIISALGQWNSWRAHKSSEEANRHTQIVSFEQRKQQVRQILFEAQLRLGESNDHLDRVSREVPLLEADEFDLVTLSKTVSDMIAALANIRTNQQDALEKLIQIPSSPTTSARLRLEQIGGMADQVNKRTQELFRETLELIKILDS